MMTQLYQRVFRACSWWCCKCKVMLMVCSYSWSVVFAWNIRAMVHDNYMVNTAHAEASFQQTKNVITQLSLCKYIDWTRLQLRVVFSVNTSRSIECAKYVYWAVECCCCRQNERICLNGQSLGVYIPFMLFKIIKLSYLWARHGWYLENRAPRSVIWVVLTLVNTMPGVLWSRLAKMQIWVFFIIIPKTGTYRRETIWNNLAEMFNIKW